MFEASFYLYLLKIGDNLYLLADYYVLFLTRSTIDSRERKREGGTLENLQKKYEICVTFSYNRSTGWHGAFNPGGRKNATFNRAWKVSPELLFLSLHCMYNVSTKF